MNKEPERILAQHILENAEKYEWSLQGLGMLRTYLPNNSRLHVWNSNYKVDGVSTFHDHPWNLYSNVIAGVVTNKIYYIQHSYNENYMCQKIKCGEGGGLVGSEYPVRLDNDTQHVYYAGDNYHQYATIVHESVPINGTVTLLQRTLYEDKNKDYAHVFWPIGEEWVSAEPRPATEKEISDIVNHSLKKYF